VAENSDVDAVSSASVVTINGEAKGRIQALAEMIQAETGRDLFSIQTSVEYPGDGWKLVDYAQEQQNNNARPEITNHIENLDDYDTILVGYPIWWGIAAWPVNGFVSANDFTGKAVIPFCTAFSSGIGQSGILLERLTNTGTWLDGHRFPERPSQAEIDNWVGTLDLG
jgi:flavodoxin